MYEYGVDKAAIKAYPETINAHAIGMETKEHLFYTGLLLATLTPMIAYTIDVAQNKAARRLLILTLALIITGGSFSTHWELGLESLRRLLTPWGRVR